MRSLVGMLLPLFRVLDLETSNALMPGAEELMILNRLLIVPGVEHALRTIWVNLCLLVLRPGWSFLPAQVRLWNDLPYSVFHTGMLDGFKGAVNCLLLPCVFFCFPCRRCLWGCESNL